MDRGRAKAPFRLLAASGFFLFTCCRFVISASAVSGCLISFPLKVLLKQPAAGQTIAWPTCITEWVLKKFLLSSDPVQTSEQDTQALLWLA